MEMIKFTLGILGILLGCLMPFIIYSDYMKGDWLMVGLDTLIMLGILDYCYRMVKRS